jgi:hypothetical protein
MQNSLDLEIVHPAEYAIMEHSGHMLHTLTEGWRLYRWIIST